MSSNTFVNYTGLSFSMLRSRDIRGAKAGSFVSPLRQRQTSLVIPGVSMVGTPRLGVGKTASRRDGKQPGGEEEIAYDRMEAAAPAAGKQAEETGDRVPRPTPA